MRTWRMALIRIFKPNEDLAVEIFEWVIAIISSAVLIGIGFVVGRITR